MLFIHLVMPEEDRLGCAPSRLSRILAFHDDYDLG